jgi:hypothetical protein
MVGRERVIYRHPDYRDYLAFSSGDIVGFLDSSNRLQTDHYNGT